jgi:DNA-binding NarL/FixJ family response regulator
MGLLPCLAEAELLLEHYPRERAEATAHLDFATSEFEALGMQPALARALRLRAGRPRSAVRPAVADPEGLSDREIEVLRLVARGKSNREIASDLFLSVRTVDRHIANIYAKTGLHTKAQATAYALNRGLAEKIERPRL